MSAKIKPTVELLAALVEAVYLKNAGRNVEVIGKVTIVKNGTKRYYGTLQGFSSTSQIIIYRTEPIFNNAEEAKTTLQSIYDQRNKIIGPSMEKLTEIIKTLNQPEETREDE